MFVDDVLKRVYDAYKTVPGLEPLTTDCAEFTLPRLFKATGNNVHHYQEWNEAWELALPGSRKIAQIERDVNVLAEALDHARPVQRQHLRGYAVNLASLVLLAIGGTYYAFVEQIRAALMEISGVGAINDPWVQHELRPTVNVRL